MSKIKISDVALIDKVREQVVQLKKLCELYDNGEKIFISKIALNIRVLLHNTKNCKSAYESLKSQGLRAVLFPDTRGYNHLHDLNEGKIDMVSSKMYQCDVSTTSSHIKYKISYKKSKDYNYWNFQDWWNNATVLFWGNNVLCRRDIVCMVADQDGGAHIDNEIDERLYVLRNSIPATATIVFNNTKIILNSNDILNSVIRAIAEEVIYTFENSIFTQLKNRNINPHS